VCGRRYSSLDSLSSIIFRLALVVGWLDTGKPLDLLGDQVKRRPNPR